MFRLGLAVGRALIRTGLRIARAPRRRALARWAASEALALDGRTRARGTRANGFAVDALLDEESNAATIEMTASVVLPSVAIRSRHAVVRSPEASIGLEEVERSLSGDQHRSPSGLYGARAERVAEDRLEAVFALLEAASSPPTTLLVRPGAVFIEIYPPTSAAVWTEHTQLLDAVISILTTRARGPYG